MQEHRLRLSPAGLPELWEDGTWKSLDFNRLYAGYYPACHFTAGGTIRDALYLAGTDGQSVVHLFCSTGGSVWEPVNLAPRDQPKLPQYCGDVRVILENPVDGSLLLVCENGYVLTLPGCPKCVKETHWNKKFTDGQIIEDNLALSCTSGETVTIPLGAVQQLRAGWLYAEKAEGVVIDLRDEDAEPPLPGAVCERLPQAMLHLRQRRYGQKPVFFFCYTGTQADTAALAARKMGFSQIYSLGGVAQITETNNGVWPGRREE